jgi:hypothetical protein
VGGDGAWILPASPLNRARFPRERSRRRNRDGGVVRACERLGVWFVLRFELGGRWAMCRCGTLVAATALNFFKKIIVVIMLPRLE